MSEYFYTTVWNMNGGPVPSSVMESLQNAVDSILKEAEEKDGVRLLSSSKGLKRKQRV